MKVLRFFIRRFELGCCMFLTAVFAASCGDDTQGTPSGITGITVSQPAGACEVKGLFVLNEGQMNTNKSSLDYFDYGSGKFYNKLFSKINPDVTLGLGDTGNDLKLYDGRLYAVMNGSGLIEVMDARTLRHVGYVSLPGCRCISFSGTKAYVSSYSGEMDVETKLMKGTLAEIDLSTLKVTRTCAVGYQPEGVAVRNGKVYVANSCAYGPDYETFYDRTVSVVDAASMTPAGNIDVAINLGTVQLGGDGRLYTISRGNYYDVKSDVYVVDTDGGVSLGALGVRASSLCMVGDSLYIVANEYSATNNTYERSFIIYDTRLGRVVSDRFITDGTDSRIVAPYGVAVNPENGDVFIPDAGDYVNPGTLYCYSRDGKLRWTAVTGNIPGHMAFSDVEAGWAE